MLYNYINNFYISKWLNEEISWNLYYTAEFIIYNLLICIIILNLYKLINQVNIIVTSTQLKYWTCYLLIFFYIYNLNSIGPVSVFFFNKLYITSSYNNFFFLNIIVLYLLINLIFTINFSLIKLNYNILIYVILLMNLLTILFLITNLFTLIFIIELISIILFILLTIFNNYNIINFNYENLTNYIISNNTIKPTYQFYSLILFFWISFITSINFFFYIIYFIYYINTFDLVFIDYLVLYTNLTITTNTNFHIYFLFLGFLINWFLKLGLVPFFFWKPNVFKGLAFYFLLIYIFYFYFIFLLYTVYLFIFFFNELVNFIIFGTILLIYFGLIFLILFLFEITNIKVFLAYSSILNTLLIFIILFFNIYNNIQYIYY